MTPALLLAKKSGIDHRVHEYDHEAGSDSYGLEAAIKMGISEQRVFKTLVVKLNSGELTVGVVPVSGKLNLKRIAKAAGAKKAEMADPALVERTTGYILGGVSPLGQKKRLKTVIDSSAQAFETVYVSAGRRGLEIELAPDDLKSLVNGLYGDIAERND